MSFKPRRPRQTGVKLGDEVVRNRILLAATRVFISKGLRDSSVEDLLAQAQLSRRTFYRFFKGKEDVALALYELGTKSLLDSCQRAIASSDDVLVQLEKCVDIHLSNARTLGQVVYVLGGAAQSLESPLHPLRMKAHDRLVEMFRAASPEARQVDPLLIRTLLFALEQVTRSVLEQGDKGRKVTSESIARARAVMMRVATATVAGTGPRVAPLPLPEGHES